MSVMRSAATLVLVAVLGATAGEAQSLAGVLRDSLLTGGPLPNATIRIEGTDQQAKTDLFGRFRFDSVSPGTHRLTFTHPVFDAAGVGSPRWRIDVPRQGLQGVLLATPSADTRYGRACPGPRPAEAGYLIGVVRDAAADSGLGGATVNAMWTEITVSRTAGVRTNRRTARAETDAHGQFIVCQVPNDGEITVWATLHGASTGLITLDLGRRPLAARQLVLSTRSIAGAATAADSAVLGARLDGVVKNLDGEPIPDARVYVRGSRAVTQTTASGAFSLGSLPAGTQVVEVTALGYQAGRETVDLKPGGTARTELVLGKSVQRLQPVEVVGKMKAGNDISSFEDRARRGFGYFITEADIERRNPISFEDLMRGVPGMQVEPVGQGYRVVSARGVPNVQGECSPAYFIDGAPMQLDATNGDPFPVAPMEIAAIEVYAGTAAVPIEFQRMQNAGCGVIAIWTKRGGGRPRGAR
jgi:hypothetical protein